MKVKELIEKLGSFDPDATVFFMDLEYGPCEVKTLEIAGSEVFTFADGVEANSVILNEG